jgi:hypothetical protein
MAESLKVLFSQSNSEKVVTQVLGRLDHLQQGHPDLTIEIFSGSPLDSDRFPSPMLIGPNAELVYGLTAIEGFIKTYQ